MVISQNLQPKEVKYLKYLKGKGLDAQNSYKRLNNARSKGLFGVDTPQIDSPVIPKQPVTSTIQKLSKGEGLGDSMLNNAKTFGKTFTETIPQIGTALYEGTKGALKDIAYLKEGVKQENPSFIGRTAETIGGVGQDIKKAKILEVKGKQDSQTSLLQSMGLIAGGTSQVIGDAFISGLKTIAPEDVETAVKEGLQTAIASKGGQVVMSEVQQALDGYNYLKETNPEKARNYKAFFGALEFAGDLTGLGAITKKGVQETVKQGVKDIPIIGKYPIVGPMQPGKLKGVVQGGKIEPILPIEPTVINKVQNKIKDTYKTLEERVQKGPQEFKGVVGKEPVITQTRKTLKPNIVKGIDINKSDDLIRRGLKPSTVTKTTEAAYNRVNNDLREGIEFVTKAKGAAVDGIDALKKTANRKKEIYKTIENHNDLVSINTSIDDIGLNLDKYFTSKEGKAFLGVNPGAGQKLQSTVDNWKSIYGNNIKQNDLQLLKQEYNQTLAKSDFAKILQGNNPKALLDAKISQTLGNILDDNVMKVLGKTNKKLNYEYGKVRNLEKTLAKRMGVFNRNTKGGLVGLTDIFNLGDIVMGTLTGNVGQAGKGIVGKVVASTIKRKENPNLIIKELFLLHGKKKKTIGETIQEITGKTDKNFKGKVIKGFLPKKAGLGKVKNKQPIKLRADMSISRPKTTKGAISKPIVATKKEIKALPIGKIVTPQTIEKGIIKESQNELKKTIIKKPTTKNLQIDPGKAKIINDKYNIKIANSIIDDAITIKDLNSVKKDILESDISIKLNLIKDIDNRIAGLEASNILENIPKQLNNEYGNDLMNSFKKVYSSDIIAIKTKTGDKYTKIEELTGVNGKDLVSEIDEYINSSPWEEGNSIQDIYDKIKDRLVNISSKELKITVIKKPKAISNKGGYINPAEILASLKVLTPKNLVLTANKIAKQLGVEVQKVTKILKEYLKEYGVELKNKAGDLIDDLADRVGARMKFIDDSGNIIEDTKDLMALHNLSIDKLKSIQELGGMPGPSIAITKKGIPFDDFGDITLVGNQRLVTSQNAKTFDADIYSPRVPSPSYTIKKTAYKDVIIEGKLLEKYGVKGSDLLQDLGQQYTNNSFSLRLKFAKDNNIRFKTEMKYPVSSASFQGYNQVARQDIKTIKNNIPKFNKDNLTNNQFLEQMQGIMDSFFGTVKAPELRFFDAESLYTYLKGFNKAQVIDNIGTYRNIKDIINNRGLEDKYDIFIKDLTNKFFDKKLYKGTSDTTGRQIYQDYTLDNVVKNMFKGGMKGNESGMFTGNLSQTIGKNAKPLNIAKIKKVDFAKTDKLDKQYNILKDEWSDLAMGVDGNLIDDYFSINGNIDTIANSINQYATYTKISTLNIKRMQEIAKETIKLPKSYIETKIKRPVGLQEFTYAVVPKGQVKAVKNVLKGTGLDKKVIGYGTEKGARTKILKDLHIKKPKNIK